MIHRQGERTSIQFIPGLFLHTSEREYRTLLASNPSVAETYKNILSEL